MQVTAWDIYWITRLDSIKAALVVAFILAAVLVLLLTVSSDGECWTIRHLRRWMIAGLLAFTVAVTFTPTTKEMVAIKVIPAIAANEDVQALPAEFVKLAREWMEELKPERGQ